MAKNKITDEFEELEDFDLEEELEEEAAMVELADDLDEEESISDEEFFADESVEDEGEEEAVEEIGTNHPSEESEVEESIFGNDLELRPSNKAKWYVVHTYSGHENKVKINIEKIVENRGMQDLVLDIVVPTEDHVEIKNGQRKVKTRKMFPGYVLVKMIVTNESWYLVRNTQGVTGFVGHGSEPIPLTAEEVKRMGIEKVYFDLDIEPGDSVKVINGPFESFMGVVEEVNMDKQTLKVKISMFGRDTPVELEFGQVDKI